MKKKLNIVVSALLLSVMVVGTSASAAGNPGPCPTSKPCHIQV